MGDLRFKVPNAEKMDPRVWETAYISGMEGIPWYCHRCLDGDQFTIGRDIEESGKLNIVWPTRSLGNVCLSTTSLRIVEKPYSLYIELARGTVYRMKNQCAEWQRIGLKLPTEFFPISEQALIHLLNAITTRNNPAKQASLAQLAIDSATEAGVILCDSFSSQVLDIRLQNEGRFSTLLGCRIQPQIELASVSDAIKTTFNLLAVDADLNTIESASGTRDYSLADRQIDWALQNGLRVCVGPLLNFKTGGLPRWMVLLDQSFETVMRVACEHALETVERYRGKVQLWNCAVGLNAPGELHWSDEEVLRLSVSLIETVRKADERCPVLLTIDQPFSEYLGNIRDGISPLHFADALIRADLGLSGLALQLNLDTWPNGSLPRDPIDISRLIDRWGLLGLPLMLIVTNPSQLNGQNKLAGDSPPKQSSRVSAWENGDIGPSQGFKNESLIRMLLAKPTVHAVIWNQTSDQVADGLENAGLWDAQGKPKSMLTGGAALRQKYLH